MAISRNNKRPTKKPLLLRRKSDPKGVENKTPLLLRRKKLTGNNQTSNSTKKESTSKVSKFGERYLKNLRAKQARLNSKPKAKSSSESKRKPVKSLVKPKVSGIVKKAGISKPKGTVIKKAPVKAKPTTAKQARKEGRAERKSLRETKRAKRFVQRKANQASRRNTRTQNATKRQAKRTARVKKRTTK